LAISVHRLRPRASHHHQRACQIGVVAASVLSAFERLRELHRLNVRREPGHAVESIV